MDRIEVTHDLVLFKKKWHLMQIHHEEKLCSLSCNSNFMKRPLYLTNTSFFLNNCLFFNNIYKFILKVTIKFVFIKCSMQNIISFHFSFSDYINFISYYIINPPTAINILLICSTKLENSEDLLKFVLNPFYSSSIYPF